MVGFGQVHRLRGVPMQRGKAVAVQARVVSVAMQRRPDLIDEDEQDEEPAQEGEPTP